MLRRNPFVYDSLLIGQGGKRTISKVTPSFVHNTVDNPIFPNAGKRLTASIDLAVLGGNTQFVKPRLEGIWFFSATCRAPRSASGAGESSTDTSRRAAAADDATTLPIFERLFLGGEYSVRGFDIRSIGPTVPGSLVVLGGNKSLLFNAEYLISIMPARCASCSSTTPARCATSARASRGRKTSTGSSRRRSRRWSIRSRPRR